MMNPFHIVFIPLVVCSALFAPFGESYGHLAKSKPELKKRLGK